MGAGQVHLNKFVEIIKCIMKLISFDKRKKRALLDYMFFDIFMMLTC
jgi:hypothetical protein